MGYSRVTGNDDTRDKYPSDGGGQFQTTVAFFPFLLRQSMKARCYITTGKMSECGPSFPRIHSCFAKSTYAFPFRATTMCRPTNFRGGGIMGIPQIDRPPWATLDDRTSHSASTRGDSGTLPFVDRRHSNTGSSKIQSHFGSFMESLSNPRRPKVNLWKNYNTVVLGLGCIFDFHQDTTTRLQEQAWSPTRCGSPPTIIYPRKDAP